MPITIVQYRTRPDRAEENQALVEAVFAELRASAPDGLRYESFVHVAEVSTADGTNPLTGTAAFAEFVREIGDRCVEGPRATSASLVGEYGFLAAPEATRG